MPVILSFFNTVGVRRTPNQTDSDVTFLDRAIKGKLQKDWKIIRAEKNPFFSERIPTQLFFLFF